MSNQLLNTLPLSLPTQMPGGVQAGHLGAAGSAPAGFSFTSLLTPQAEVTPTMPWFANGQSLPMQGDTLPSAADGSAGGTLLADLDATVAAGGELSAGQLQALSEMLPEPLRNLDRLKQLAEESDDPVLQALARQLGSGAVVSAEAAVEGGADQHSPLIDTLRTATQASAVDSEQHPASAQTQQPLTPQMVSGDPEPVPSSSVPSSSVAVQTPMSPPPPQVAGNQLPEAEISESDSGVGTTATASASATEAGRGAELKPVTPQPQVAQQQADNPSQADGSRVSEAVVAKSETTSNVNPVAAAETTPGTSGQAVSGQAEPDPIDSPAAPVSQPAVEVPDPQAKAAGPVSQDDSVSADSSVRPVVAAGVQSDIQAEQESLAASQSLTTDEEKRPETPSPIAARPGTAVVDTDPVEEGQGSQRPVESAQQPASPQVSDASVAVTNNAAATVSPQEAAVSGPVSVTGRQNTPLTTATSDSIVAESESKRAPQPTLSDSAGRQPLQPVTPQPQPLAAAVELVSSGGRFEAAPAENLQALLQRPVQADKATTDLFSPGSSMGAESLSRTEAAAASVSAMQATTATGVREQPHQMQMNNQPQLNTPGWRNEMGEKAIWLTTQNNKVAEIQLDPPELGALRVRVQVNQDQVSLSFSSPHGNVREAVEQAMPRLREMFAEQGMTLAESSVSDQSGGQANEGRERSTSEFAGYQPGVQGEADEGEMDAPQAAARSISLVDYYA